MPFTSFDLISWPFWDQLFIVHYMLTNFKCGLGLEWDPPSLVRTIG